MSLAKVMMTTEQTTMSPIHEATPYTVVIDSREGLPYSFTRPLEVRHPRRRTLAVQTTRAGLASGDYSLVGFESRIAIERKSVADLFNTLGSGRGRFQRELARLSSYSFSAIVVESEWSSIFRSPPPHSQMDPRTIFMTVVSWQQTYPHVHWWFVESREVGEAVTIRMLDKWWRMGRVIDDAKRQPAPPARTEDAP